ncbi:putative non-specific serine/threonine protein kinase [Helianthus annuus]|uniref:Non-specific serine/threonine protein kinase n=1 Tax=Helianthus annuus TaxID=4232 RepID=A0A9K3H4S3_HELAN|nr:putative non-specific serine/threonine protein kinase [Helianthus annuus]KAF5764758.1 putative non-specific serine/threonine protein kinase [Helianthus annuus]KAJ0451400.1 putative non-specific serine/threonine protein kinase [Helianthus annuus]KAJ0451403.1 putative non-specific serine/threonine protein kinase [Helianthus annuus]KAJ0455895.1 putative non-specific serine/threonine protein kinase [Helianthus annuus]
MGFHGEDFKHVLFSLCIIFNRRIQYPKACFFLLIFVLFAVPTLSVEDNLMSATIPEELGNLASIERLFLNSNSFSGTLLASFANLNTIKEFRIGGNNFSGKIPDYIGLWQSLKSL